MTYLLLSLPFVAAGLGVFTIGVVRAHRRGTARSYLRSWVVATGILLALTIVFDNVMMAAGLFDYGSEQISGVRLGLIPVEDLLYPVAGALLLAGLWEVLGDGTRREEEPRD